MVRTGRDRHVRRGRPGNRAHGRPDLCRTSRPHCGAQADARSALARRQGAQRLVAEVDLIVFDDAAASDWYPFTLTRPAGELLLGTLKLRERLERVTGA